jgi:hypothetical protein
MILLLAGCETWEARVYAQNDRASNKITSKSGAFSKEGCQKKLSAMVDEYDQKGIKLYHWECQITACTLC